MSDFDTAAATVLDAAPDVLNALRAAHTAAGDAVDPDVLSPCVARVAMLLGRPGDERLARWPSDPGYSAAQRACLAFTEQFVIDVASLDDDCAALVSTHLGGAGLAAFTSALLVAEQRIRLEMMWTRLGL